MKILILENPYQENMKTFNAMNEIVGPMNFVHEFSQSNPNTKTNRHKFIFYDGNDEFERQIKKECENNNMLYLVKIEKWKYYDK